MGILGWIGVALAAALAFVILQFIYLSTVLKWEHEKSVGLAYYGLPPKERAGIQAQAQAARRPALAGALALRQTLQVHLSESQLPAQGHRGPDGKLQPREFRQGRQLPGRRRETSSSSPR